MHDRKHTTLIFPLLLLRSKSRRAPVSLCLLIRNNPVPNSFQPWTPSFFAKTWTLVRTSYAVSSSSSPSPSASWDVGPPKAAGVGSRLLAADDSPSSSCEATAELPASAGLAKLNGVLALLASGVGVGLPLPNPYPNGFPIEPTPPGLLLFVLPKPLKVPNDGSFGGVAAGVVLTAALVSAGLPPKKLEVEGAGFVEVPKAFEEEEEGDDPKVKSFVGAGLSVFGFGLKAKGFGEAAAVVLEGVGPRLNALEVGLGSEAFVATEPFPNVNTEAAAEPPGGSEGLNPPELGGGAAVVVVVVVPPKPMKPFVGGLGIEKAEAGGGGF